MIRLFFRFYAAKARERGRRSIIFAHSGVFICGNNSNGRVDRLDILNMCVPYTSVERNVGKKNEVLSEPQSYPILLRLSTLRPWFRRFVDTVGAGLFIRSYFTISRRLMENHVASTFTLWSLPVQMCGRIECRLEFLCSCIASAFDFKNCKRRWVGIVLLQQVMCCRKFHKVNCSFLIYG